MVDTISPHDRAENMRRVKSKDTQPEKAARQLLSAFGYRYRLNVNTIPGRPDIVLSSLRVLIFVNGCFWHGHDCNGTRLPKSNRKHWGEKIKRNKARDARN